jgi:hypothetical protein
MNSGRRFAHPDDTCFASSLRKQGPITTGPGFFPWRRVSVPKDKPRRMGPRVRGDDVERMTSGSTSPLRGR